MLPASCPSPPPQYVAAIPGGYVQGEGGLVFDARRHVYDLPYFHYNRTSTTLPLPASSAPPAACERYASLATVVQRFGHMYYHFLAETLPRVVLLQRSGLLTPDVRLLSWGMPWERQASAVPQLRG